MRRKTEAWLVELPTGAKEVRLSKASAESSFRNSTYGTRLTPLVRRDARAEAVVRAAEKLVRWWEEMGTACNPGSLNADPADRMMGAVHALLASRKRVKR